MFLAAVGNEYPDARSAVARPWRERLRLLQQCQCSSRHLYLHPRVCRFRLDSVKPLSDSRVDMLMARQEVFEPYITKEDRSLCWCIHVRRRLAGDDYKVRFEEKHDVIQDGLASLVSVCWLVSSAERDEFTKGVDFDHSTLEREESLEKSIGIVLRQGEVCSRVVCTDKREPNDA